MTPCAAGKGDQQQPDRQHQPGLVGVPERADRRDHDVLLGIVGGGEQDADAEVEAVEHDIDQDGEAHQAGEDQGEEGGEVGVMWRAADRCCGRSTSPPSVLPDISPARGRSAAQVSPICNVGEWRGAKTADLPPCGGDVRQDRGGCEGDELLMAYPSATGCASGRSSTPGSGEVSPSLAAFSDRRTSTPR